jgi:uncharacterized membrane protein YdjX (TVP38/TMEM64 family)
MIPSRRRWLILIPLILVVAFFAFDLHHAIDLKTIKSQQAEFLAFRTQHPVATLSAFLLAYIAVGMLPLPGAVIVTVLAGALFGVAGGWLVAAVMGSIGAALGFALSRYLLRDWLRERYAQQIARVNEGLERDGPLYLFTLRLLPVLPFFLVNLSFGLSPMRLRTFFVITQIGMAPGALVFTNAGSELSSLRSLNDVFSPELLASFAALALFPWAARAIVGRLRSSP